MSCTSRSDLLAWLNELLHLNLTKLEQLSTGVVYVHVFDALLPGRVPLHRVNFAARSRYEVQKNYKVLVDVLARAGVDKVIDAAKLSKGSPNDSLELLQWLKRYFDKHAHDANAHEYNAVERRRALNVHSVVVDGVELALGDATSHSGFTAPSSYADGAQTPHAVPQSSSRIPRPRRAAAAAAVAVAAANANATATTSSSSSSSSSSSHAELPASAAALVAMAAHGSGDNASNNVNNTAAAGAPLSSIRRPLTTSNVSRPALATGSTMTNSATTAVAAAKENAGAADANCDDTTTPSTELLKAQLDLERVQAERDHFYATLHRVQLLCDDDDVLAAPATLLPKLQHVLLEVDAEPTGVPDELI